jgi:hypothetical protein
LILRVFLFFGVPNKNKKKQRQKREKVRRGSLSEVR